MKVDVSEIEPSLHDLAVKYFKVPKTDRLTSHVEDGRRFLFDTDKSYDYIFSDVYYSLYSIPAHFTTVEFFEIAKQKLNNNGLFIASIIGDLSRKEPSFILSEIRTFQSVFSNSYIFAVDSPAKAGPQIIILLGHKGDAVLDFSDESVHGHDDAFIRALADHLVDMDRFELSAYTALSDNYSPIEYFTAKMIERNFGNPTLPDGEEMMALIAQQSRYGPRYLSAEGHARVIDFIQAEMDALTGESKANHGNTLARMERYTSLPTSLAVSTRQQRDALFLQHILIVRSMLIKIAAALPSRFRAPMNPPRVLPLLSKLHASLPIGRKITGCWYRFCFL